MFGFHRTRLHRDSVCMHHSPRRKVPSLADPKHRVHRYSAREEWKTGGNESLHSRSPYKISTRETRMWDLCPTSQRLSQTLHEPAYVKACHGIFLSTKHISSARPDRPCRKPVVFPPLVPPYEQAHDVVCAWAPFFCIFLTSARAKPYVDATRTGVVS